MKGRADEIPEQGASAGARSLESPLDEFARRLATDTRLTPRETQILLALVRGADRAELAVDLGVAENTVKTHVKNLLRKTDSASVEAALRRVLRASSRPPPEP